MVPTMDSPLSLENFQVDLENVLTMSQLVGEVSTGGQAGLGDAGHSLPVPRTRLQPRLQ